MTCWSALPFQPCWAISASMNLQKKAMLKKARLTWWPDRQQSCDTALWKADFCKSRDLLYTSLLGMNKLLSNPFPASSTSECMSLLSMFWQSRSGRTCYLAYSWWACRTNLNLSHGNSNDISLHMNILLQTLIILTCDVWLVMGSILDCAWSLQELPEEAWASKWCRTDVCCLLFTK